MKIKKEYIIAAVIIAASVLYLVFQKDSRVNYEVPRFAEIERENITSVKISGSGESLNLKKEGEQWKLYPGAYKADSSQINQLLAEAVNLSIVDLISSRDDYSRYELDEENALHVVISADNEPVKEFMLGKTSDSRVYSYISLPGTKGIYSVRGDVKSRFPLSADLWRDKQVLNFNPEEVTSIEISREGETVILARSTVTETPGWTKNGSVMENPAEIQSNLESLGRLKCSEFLDSAEGEPMVSIRITAGSSIHSAEIYEKLDNGYSARSSFSEDPFLIPVYLGDMLLEM